MSSRHAIRRLIPLATLVALAGCGDPGGRPYPQLLPLSQLNAPPAVPAHAADAATDPASVESALRNRGAAAHRHAPAAGAPPAGDAALAARAAALRARADALAATDPAAAAAPTPTPTAETDPETAARAEALRQRARDMLGTSAGELPPCPPATADPEAADCAPH